jgi:hypothetical protein
MYAGMAAYQKKDMQKAISLLDGVTAGCPEQDIYRLTVLEKAIMAKDPQKAALYKAQKQAVIDKNGAQSYYDSNIFPLLDALGNTK